jgi:hypothetical protein
VQQQSAAGNVLPSKTAAPKNILNVSFYGIPFSMIILLFVVQQ